jgi:hypothetical protein
MGEYAEDTASRDFENHLDELMNSFPEDYEPGPDDISSHRGKRSSSRSADPDDELCYEEIITQTDKAWLLKMDVGTEIWWPKSQCTLDEEECMIFVPHWLVLKKTEEGLK